MATWKIVFRTGACREGRGDANRATHVNHVFWGIGYACHTEPSGRYDRLCDSLTRTTTRLTCTLRGNVPQTPGSRRTRESGLLRSTSSSS